MEQRRRVNSPTASGGSRRPSRSRRTSRRRRGPVPLRDGLLRAHPRRRHARLDIPLGAMCRKGLAPHFDADDVFLVTKQGLDFFHDHFDYPYPFGKYDQAFVPEYNLGAMENPGLVTFREEYIFRGKVTQASYEAPGQRHPARDGAHVVRRPGDHGVVGRPVAEGVLRRLHGHVRERRRDPLHRRLDHLRQPPQGLGLPRRPAALHPPDHRRHPRPAGRQAQLRRHHLRQGRLASSSSWWRTWARTPSWRAPAATSSGNAYGNTRLGDLLSVLAETGGRDMAAWSRAWLQTAGVNSLTPQVVLSAEGRIAELAVVQEAAESHPELRPHRVAVGLYRRESLREGDGRARPLRPRRGGRRRPAHGRRGAGRRRGAGPGAGQRRRPHLLQDPLRRGLAGHAAGGASARSPTRSRGPCAGRRCGT